MLRAVPVRQRLNMKHDSWEAKVLAPPPRIPDNSRMFELTAVYVAFGKHACAP
jgi:hypothetical protein